MNRTGQFRKTTQHLIPVEHSPAAPGVYDIYPTHDIGPGRIGIGFAELARRIAGWPTVAIDGYVGIDWKDFRARLDAELNALGVRTRWIDVEDALLAEDRIEAMAAPFLGGDDPLFGTRFTGTLAHFFDANELRALRPTSADGTCIVYGCGAALAAPQAKLVYVDLPKNEIQFRSRAGVVRNLGRRTADPPKAQYKRFYFVDWVALNAHKKALLPRIDLFVDGQRPDAPTFADGDRVRAALASMARTAFRVRPWFEPGPWGGQWIREHIPGLATEVPNYAWSFELIVPENGLLLESDGRMLEVSFDCLMFAERDAVLGRFAARFGDEFPLRFDFLDTFGGGNLSVQCHPRVDYVRRHFGESFTQDETYYILDCNPGAEVYLGFNDGIRPEEFEAALRESHRSGTELDVRRFVNVERAEKHDLFLIPNGTIHCSGIDNLVLEISATPYIFTFKMYDWMRMDLDGRPRPLNIDRAMENLDFSRCGEAVRRDLVARPREIRRGGDFVHWHLPTHPEHFYDVHRLEFSGPVAQTTDGSPHVLSLVEGRTVVLETADGTRRRFAYAETFVVPADAKSYRLVPENGETAKVVVALLKPGAA